MPPAVRPFAATLAAGALACALLACGGAEGSGAPPAADAGGGDASTAPGNGTCARGFELDDEGDCREILPDAACPPGTRPHLGSKGCVAVGPVSCPAGLGPDEDGWGCVARALPACTGATRPSYEAGACVPVGDCAAPFPPAGAAVVVDPTFTDAELSPTRVRTIAEGVFAAPRGGLVAVAAGTYAESIQPQRSVTVVGRCAAAVRVVGTGLGGPGVFTRRAISVTAKGMTFVDHFQGLRAEGGGEIRAEDVVVEDARLFGAISYQAGSRVTVARSVFRRSRNDGSSVGGLGVTADESGAVELEDVAIEDSETAGVVATNYARKGEPSRVVGRRVVVRGTAARGTGGDAPAGLAAFDLSEVVVEDSVVGFAPAFAAFASDEGRVVAKRSTFARVESPRALALVGAYAQLGGRIQIEGSTLHDLAVVSAQASGRGSSVDLRDSVVLRGEPQAVTFRFGNGLVAGEGAALRATDTAVVRAAYEGVTAFDPGTELALERVRVVGVRPSPREEVGHGVSVHKGARATLADVAVEGVAYSALLLGGDERTEVALDGLVVLAPVAPEGAFPTPAVRAQGGAHVTGERVVVRDTTRIGIVVSESLSAEGDPTTVDLGHVVVRGTRAFGARDGVLPGQDVLDGIGFAVATGAVGTLRDAVVTDSGQLGVASGGALTLERVTVKRTKADVESKFGVGVLAFGPARLDGVRLVDNRVGLGVSRASVSVRRSLFARNLVGLAVDGVEVREVTDDALEPGERELFVTRDVRFEENGTRVDGEQLVIPTFDLAPPAGPPPGE